MNSAEPILQPSSEENWPEGIRAVLQGPVLNIHRMMAHSPELLRQSAPLRNYLVAGSTLTGRQRELLILRTAHLIGSEYEWSHHVVRGQAAGLTPEEIERVKEGARAAGWNMTEKALLRLADEMRAAQEITTSTAAQLHEDMGPAALIDAIFTVGFYLTLGTILKSFNVPIDETT